MSEQWTNKLYFGDNLDILREHVADESVDLIYLDPPFNSNATYSVLFTEKNGTQSAAQIAAFDDTWHWDISSRQAYEEVVLAGGKISALLSALHDFLGTNDMMAYLTMMAIRLKELRRVLKSTGSIYLHCDPTASHYLRSVMDAVFSPMNFRNEIIWQRAQPKGHAYTRFSSAHDVVLFYVKSADAEFDQQYKPHDPEYVEKFYKYTDEDTGRRYRLDNLANPNKDRPNLTYEFPPGSGVVRVWRWTKERMTKAWEEGRVVIPKRGKVAAYKRYLDEMPGAHVTDIWNDIEHLHGSNAERLGYPTQKPEALLERIIQASSNEGDIVLDPFCGCGTTIAVAERLHRRWIGIDLTHLAVNLMKARLHDSFGPDLQRYQVISDPKDVGSARALAEENRYQFEYWALGLVEGSPTDDRKKGADKGIDGNIYFFDDDSGQRKRIIVQIKSGHVTRNQIGDLRGVMEREDADMAAFVTLLEPTAPMKKEAAEAGFYQPPGLLPQVPKIQIITIEELLEDKQLEYPRISPATFKKAPRQTKAKRS